MIAYDSLSAGPLYLLVAVAACAALLLIAYAFEGRDR